VGEGRREGEKTCGHKKEENREASLLDNAYRGAMEEGRACNDATWYSHRQRQRPTKCSFVEGGVRTYAVFLRVHEGCQAVKQGNGLADPSCIRGLRGALGDRTGASALGGGGPMGEGDWVQKVSHSSTEMPRPWMLS